MNDGSDSITRWTFLLALGVFLATIITFTPAYDNGFVNWDDTALIVNNPYLRRLGWDQIRWMFTSFHLGPYQPLPWLTLALDYRIGGHNPRVYHITSVAWHAAAALVFFLVARRLLRASTPDARGQPALLETCAAIAAIVFAVHPLRVESVVWIAERRDVLAGFFLLSALWSYLRGEQGTPGRCNTGWILLSLGLFFLSLLSKATGMCFPAVLSVLDYYPLRRLTWSKDGLLDRAARRVWLEKVPFWLLGMAGGVAALYGQRAAGTLSTVEHYGPVDRIMLAASGSAFYVWKTLAPVGLSPLYEIPPDFSPWRFPFIVYAVASLCITAVAFRWGRPAFMAAWLSYLFLLAPVSGLAQTGAQRAADRYSYLPCLAFALLFGGLVLHTVRNRKSAAPAQLVIVVAVLLCLTLILGSLSWRQSRFWRDTVTLWKHALAIDPDSGLAYNNAARGFMDQNRWTEARRLLDKALERRPNNADVQNNAAIVSRRLGQPYEAMRRYREAERLNPRSADIQHNIALLLAEEKLLVDLGFSTLDEQWQAALEHYRRALSIKPDELKTLNDMGILQKKMGQLEDAIKSYERVIKLDPDNVNARYNLAIALAEQGLTNRASEEYLNVLKLQPGHIGACNNLALLRERGGRYDEAAQFLRQAMSHAPAHPVLLYHLGWLLATAPDPNIRDGAQALALMEQLHSRTEQPSAELLDAMAAAYAELGRFQEALRTAERAAELAAQQKNAQLEAQIRSRIELYKEERPYRASPE